MLGDMNAKVEDNGLDRVTGRYGESGVNEMEEKVVDLCSERFVQWIPPKIFTSKQEKDRMAKKKV